MKGPEAEGVRLDELFSEDECQRILVVAEWYAAYCRKHGREPPGDPMRALLAAAEAMELRLAYISALYEHAAFEAAGGIES